MEAEAAQQLLLLIVCFHMHSDMFMFLSASKLKSLSPPYTINQAKVKKEKKKEKSLAKESVFMCAEIKKKERNMNCNYKILDRKEKRWEGKNLLHFQIKHTSIPRPTVLAKQSV